jgi:hypothetical protein
MYIYFHQDSLVSTGNRPVTERSCSERLIGIHPHPYRESRT